MKFDPAELLRQHNLRATAGRMHLLNVLHREPLPVTIEYLRGKLRHKLNEVTLYRALDTLSRAKIVARSDFRHGHAHYELIAERRHHHHVVCRSCGIIEDVEVTHAKDPAREARQRTRGFSSVDDYALEFFGTCKTCV